MTKYLNSFFNELKVDYISIYKSVESNPMENLFTLAIAVLLPLWFVVRKSRLGRSYLMFILAFPGTVIHELLHFTIGLVTGGHPVGFSVLPKKVEGGYVMGQVSFANINDYNALPISMAPLLAPIVLLLTFPMCIEYIGESENVILLSVLYSFVLMSGINECIPSSADFQILFSRKVGFILYSLLIGYIIYKHLN